MESVACLAALAPTPAGAQQFAFPAAAGTDTVALAQYMPTLAADVIAAYRDADRRTYLDNLFRLQSVAGRYAEATVTRAALTGELSGLFSGSLDVAINKRDFDAYIAVYELNARGEYVLLTTWQMRASHARDLTTRTLLTPGQRRRLDFTSIRVVSRLLEPGSRIVALVGPIKAPVFQINLGSGKNVSDETIGDAGVPLEIRWFGDSFIDLPIRR